MENLITPEILDLLRKESAVFASPIHGVHHWKAVERNGYHLSNFNGADNKVISYFAYFHDCMRTNEDEDPNHGLHGAQFAEKHRELIELNESQFKQLTKACEGHTDGERPKCMTINTCWDADRLDIGRVGIIPKSEFLHSTEAKRIADRMITLPPQSF